MNNAGLNSDISILSMIWQTDKEKKLAVFERNWRRKMKDIYIYTHHGERKYVSHTRHLLHWISFQRRYMDRETCTNHCKTMARSFSLVSITFSSCFLFFVLLSFLMRSITKIQSSLLKRSLSLSRHVHPHFHDRLLYSSCAAYLVHAALCLLSRHEWIYPWHLFDH